MGAFSEIFFLPVTFVSCNTLLIQYYRKILQTGHFVPQNSPQDKKESVPQCSQLLQDWNKNNIWICILRGVNSRTKWAFLGYFEKIPKTPILWGNSRLQNAFRNFFYVSIPWHFSLDTLWYTLFLGSMLPQYMALSVPFRYSTLRQKKNLGHFEARYEVEIRYADCSHKYKIN